MCGFVGKFGKIDNRIKVAGDKIIHRGPDMQAFNSGKDWAVQFNRLSIIDLSDQGMQPFEYDGVKVFLNGEIYNFLELKQKYVSEFSCKTSSDVEIVPFLYRKYGMNFLNQINGMFAMVIIDEKLKKNFLVRDRYGKKPLFFVRKKNEVFFTSEIKGLKGLIELEFDKLSLATYFFCGLIPQPLTSYKNVYSIFPGSYLCVENDKIIQKSWYSPKIATEVKNFDTIKREFIDLFKKSVKLRLRSDVPVGIFLSGGLDSTAIFQAIKENNKKITALICTIPDKEKFSGTNTDSDLPKKLCKENGHDFIETVFDYDYFNKNLVNTIGFTDEFIPNSGSLIFYALSETAKKNGIKVIMTGAGGDEIFGGYPWQNKIRLLPNIFINNFLQSKKKISKNFLFKMSFNTDNFLLRKIQKMIKLFFYTRIWHAETYGSGLSDFMGDVKQEVYEKIDSCAEKYFDYTNSLFVSNDFNKFNFANVFTTLNFQNYNFDIACMKNSVENRAPFLDYEIFEYMMKIPDKEKNRQGIKSIFKNLLRGKLPEYIINAKKSGPSLPLNIWIESRPEVKKKINNFINRNLFYIRDYLSEKLYYQLNKSKNIFDKKYVRAFKILSFIIWAKINIDKSITNKSITLEELVAEY